jgi:hypothetical protein
MVADEDIYVILEDHVNEEIKNGRQMDFVQFNKETRTVYITTTGNLQFQYGVRQEIVVKIDIRISLTV